LDTNKIFMSENSHTPSPALFFETINAYQRTAAIKGAVDLDLFTSIAAGNTTTELLAKSCQADERGVRILCDYLVILGFLTKTAERYGLTPDSAIFLDRSSPAYMGGVVDFMLAPMMNDAFKDVAAAVKKGGTILPDEGSIAPDHTVWVDFAKAMAPMMGMPSQMIAKLVQIPAGRTIRILDVAAGHGVFGIAFAQQYSNVEVTALDWAAVLEVAKENAERMGVGERYNLLSGSAFDVDYGNGYDLVLLTNFLHHFDPATNEKLLRKVHDSLADGGRAVTLDFIPNEDRVTPPGTAAFSMTMLGTTPHGEAYTFAELEKMFQNAGFSSSELLEAQVGLERVVISYK
jgi:ubiquinone/menaquinone biosynthesis C-methylase UbiE